MTLRTTRGSLTGPQLEALVTRAGLVGTAIACWQAAALLWEAGDFVNEPASVFLSFALYGLSGALFVLASLRARPGKRWPLLTLAALLLVVVAFGYQHAVGQKRVYITTDAYIFQDYAAQLVRLGQNPYAHDMADALRAHRMRMTFNTPLLDGDYTGRVAYPALSFLLFVPFQMIGFPTQYVYILFFVGVVLLLFLAAPPPLRTVVPLLLFIDPRYVTYSLGGVTDIVWAFTLCLCILTWRRKGWSAFWFGVTCAYKQQPWLLAPFIVIYIVREAELRGVPPRERWLAALRYGLTAAGVFLALNLPYMLWDFSAWLKGVLEPIAGSSLIFYGQGLSALTMQGMVIIPKTFYSLYTYGIWGFLVLLYWRHWHQMRHLIWITPAFILWFGHRSLTSYWYFYAIPFVFSLLINNVPELESDFVFQRIPRPNGRPVVIAGGGLAVLILGTVVGFAAARPPLDVEVLRPIQSTNDFVGNLRVKVTNRTSQPMQPRFSVQSRTAQPYYWNIEDGPPTLAPGGSATYIIRQKNTDLWFSITDGAQVVVSDSADYGLRGSEVLAGQQDALYVDDVPRGSFDYWRGDVPAYWGLAAPAPLGSKVEYAPVPEVPAVRNAVRLEVPPTPGDTLRPLMLDTWMTVPDVPIDLWVKPPAGANNPADLRLAYGLELRPTPGNQALWVLFGPAGKAQTGEVSPNTRYILLPAPADTWSRQRVDAKALLAQAGIAPGLPYNLPTRFNYLQYPVPMMNFRLLLAAKGTTEPVAALFGPVQSAAPRPNVADIARGTLAQAAQVSLMRGEYNRSVGNLDRAAAYFQQVVEAAPTQPQGYYGLGEIALRREDWANAAAYLKRADALGDAQRALVQSGLAWVSYQQGDVEAAYSHMQAAINQLGIEPYLYDTWDGAVIYTRLGWILLARGDAAGARTAFQQALLRSPSLPEAAFGGGLADALAGQEADGLAAMREAVDVGYTGAAGALAGVLSRAGQCDTYTRYAAALGLPVRGCE
jgi:tetratricopeptide (TPR) repeat protein